MSEVCTNAHDCPPDKFQNNGAPCNGRSGDKCDGSGVCTHLCKTDAECNDNDACTEDTCSKDNGQCLFTSIVGCVTEPPPLPPANCANDSSFRFDLLEMPKSVDGGDVVTTCFFPVKLASLDGAAIARTFTVASPRRAISFGIQSSKGADAKIRENATLMMLFPPQWTAAIESLTISSVGADTLLAVVRDSPTSDIQRANIAAALSAYDNISRTVTMGVWLILKPGEQLAPPAIVAAPANSWAVMHLRGRPFSVDVVKFSRPYNSERKLEWFPVPGGVAGENTTTATTTLARVEVTSSDGALVGGIIGGLIALLVLIAGAFAFTVWWKRRNAATNGDTQMYETPATAMDNDDDKKISAYHSLPPAPPRYGELKLSQRPPGTQYDDGRALSDVHVHEEVADFT